MQEIFEKIKERLEEKIFKAELHDFGWEGQTVNNLLCLGDAIEIVNQVAEEDKDKYVSIGAYQQVAWERDVAIKQLHELGYGFGEKIDKEEFCEWKLDGVYLHCQHDTELVISCLSDEEYRYKYCPVCGKEIKVV